MSGQILPEIRFEVDLPAAWNRRLYMFGNGGYAGGFFEWPVSIEQRNLALRHGFAIAVTNTGHDRASEPGASFATNRQKLIDFAFRSIHATAETAKQLIRAYCGQAESHAYFGGCSKGGSQALISAQRFPKDFDGVIVGDPMIDYVGSNTKKTASKMIQLKTRLSATLCHHATCRNVPAIRTGTIALPRSRLPLLKGFALIFQVRAR